MTNSWPQPGNIYSQPPFGKGSLTPAEVEHCPGLGESELHIIQLECVGRHGRNCSSEGLNAKMELRDAHCVFVSFLSL